MTEKTEKQRVIRLHELVELVINNKVNKAKSDECKIGNRVFSVTVYRISQTGQQTVRVDITPSKQK